LAELKQVAELIPNQGVLINALPLLEAQASSEIENIVTTTYRLLLDVTRSQAWEPWILYVLHGVEDTARWTTEKISAIRDRAALTVAHVKQAAPKIYSRELVDLIFDLPYCRIQNLVEKDIAGRQAASRYLKQLVEIGVLEERAVGREKLFIHPKLMHLLTRDDNAVSPYLSVRV
jgi:Fic family protein